MRIAYKLSKFFFKLANQKQVIEWVKIYGAFDKTNYEDYTIRNLKSESSIYHGELIKWAQDIMPSPRKVLLSGDCNNPAQFVQEKIRAKEMYTAGLLDVDFKWGFDEDPPTMGQFDLIISQAILEHLLNPYKHMHDLAGLLVPDGYLIVHTVIPGF
ncbi:MAG: methyltransferase domain-containing protein [Deltaproteobacteria bacterium]|nr:methyltransferase domain-containing protein [Deltaproteobacteria bacterium]